MEILDAHDVIGKLVSTGDLKLPLDEVVTAKDRRMRLPWWGVLCVIFGTVLLGLGFVYFGRFDLARPSLLSVAMVALAIVMRWKLRQHVWFWVTITFLAVLHLPLILFVPWTSKWIPAVVIAPVGMADLFLMLWVISVVGKFVQAPDASQDERVQRTKHEE